MGGTAPPQIPRRFASRNDSCLHVTDCHNHLETALVAPPPETAAKFHTVTPVNLKPWIRRAGTMVANPPSFNTNLRWLPTASTPAIAST